jgi:hypothetical protein
MCPVAFSLSLTLNAADPDLLVQFRVDSRGTLFKGVIVRTLVHVDAVLAGDHILECRAGLTAVSRKDLSHFSGICISIITIV